MPKSSSSTAAAASMKSPFFRPSDKSIGPDGTSRFVRTPGGTTRRKVRHARDNDTKSGKEEHKSTILGCSSNLVNAIVGAGIVGLPFAIQESGFVPGICLVLVSATLTEKSLRLLIETAKHANVPSYETVAEAAYGDFGFLFVAINMFALAYGAMLSYLMIVKDTFSSMLGISKEDLVMRRAILLAISSVVILPLSCQRDMADLAKTSKMNVCFDLMMVLIVVYMSFHSSLVDDNDDYRGDENGYEYMVDGDSISVNGYIDSPVVDRTKMNVSDIDLWQIRWNTIFVGLGVLSFAFVCQHSAFIIAGSLENPTKTRWSSVTRIALGSAAGLALLMGVSGYLGFGDITRPPGVGGNILNSLPPDSSLAKLARGLLGTTMLFVYPMESFVARHACVVLLFEGRKAHEGDHTSILNRRDRRITLTVVLYLSAVIPAAIFDDLGNVLAVTGSIGGSCLSYIGPGIVYIGIHGGRLLELSEGYFGHPRLSSCLKSSEYNEKELHEESISLISGSVDGDKTNKTSEWQNDDNEGTDRYIREPLKTLLWYLLGMPIWNLLASIGKGCLTSHVTEMALKSPHPIRIGNVRFARAKMRGETDYTRVVMLQSPSRKLDYSRSLSTDFSTSERGSSTGPSSPETSVDPRRLGVTTKLLRADSLPKVSNTNYKLQTARDGTIVALPPSAFLSPPSKGTESTKGTKPNARHNYQSINQKIGAMAVAAAQAKTKEEELEDVAIEDDPQGDPPEVLDFLIAISYIIFGFVAMIAGLMSIFWS